MYLDLVSYLLIWQFLVRYGYRDDLPYNVECNTNGGKWFRNSKTFIVKTMNAEFYVVLYSSYFKLMGIRLPKLFNTATFTRKGLTADLIENEDADIALAQKKSYKFNTFGFVLLYARN